MKDEVKKYLTIYGTLVIIGNIGALFLFFINKELVHNFMRIEISILLLSLAFGSIYNLFLYSYISQQKNRSDYCNWI